MDQSTIVEYYIATVNALPPKERPTFKVGEDLRFLLGDDGGTTYLVAGNLDRVARRVCELSGATKLAVLEAIYAWKTRKAVN